MSEDAPLPPTSPHELLAELWMLTLRKTIDELKADKPSAATLTAARQFLADSNVSLDTLPQLKRTRLGGVGSLGPLPIFPEDGDTAPPPTQAAASAPFDKLEHADAPEQ